eukprot:gene31618-41051_t
MHIFPAGFGPLLVVLILLCITLSVTSAAKAQQTKSTVCPPGTKPNSTSLVHGSATGCVPLSNRDVLRAMKLLSAPPNLNGGGQSSAVGSSICQNITTIQGISVCEDRIDFQNCDIISSISSNMCDHFGSLQFEKYWSQRGCKVTVFHLFIYIKGNVCNTPAGPLKDYPNLTIVRGDMWGEKCFNCFPDFAGQIVFTVSLNTDTLVDVLGRESERFLRNYTAFHSVSEKGPHRLQPTQFDHLLNQASVDPTISYYHHSFIRLRLGPSLGNNGPPSDLPLLAESDAIFEAWMPLPPRRRDAAVDSRGDQRALPPH